MIISFESVVCGPEASQTPSFPLARYPVTPAPAQAATSHLLPSHLPHGQTRITLQNRKTKTRKSISGNGSNDSLSSETAETALGGGGGGTPLPESVPAGGRTETLSLCGPETVGRTGGAKMRTGGRWHARTDGRADGKIGDDYFL